MQHWIERPGAQPVAVPGKLLAAEPRGMKMYFSQKVGCVRSLFRNAQKNLWFGVCTAPKHYAATLRVLDLRDNEHSVAVAFIGTPD